MRGRHAQQLVGGHILVTTAENGQRLADVAAADALGRDAQAPGTLAGIETIVGQLPGDHRQALLHLDMVEIGQTREDHPARILLEAHRRRGRQRLAQRHRRVAVADARRRPEQHWRAVPLRKLEGIDDHLVGLFGRCRVEHRQFAEEAEGARVLLGLRRDGTRVVGDHHHHAALDAQIGKAHQRIGGDIEADLLHGHHRSRAGHGGTGGHFQSHLLVDRPLDVDVAGVARRHRRQNLGGRGTRITAHHPHARCKRTEADRLVAHQKLNCHSGCPTLPERRIASPVGRRRPKPAILHFPPAQIKNLRSAMPESD